MSTLEATLHESIVPQEPAEPAGPAPTLESLLTAYLRSVSRPYNLLTVWKSSFIGCKDDLQMVWRSVWMRVWRAVWEEWEEVSYVFQLAPYCRTTTKRPPAGIEPARGIQSWHLTAPYFYGRLQIYHLLYEPLQRDRPSGIRKYLYKPARGRNASGQGHSTVNFPVRNAGGRSARLLIYTVTPI